MIIFSFLILDFIISLLIMVYSPLSAYLHEWYFFLICIACILVVFIGIVIVFIIFLSIYLLPIDMKKEAKCSKFDMALMKRASELVLQVSNIKLHVRGLEKIDPNKKFLLIQNHLSNYDVICTTWALRYFDISFIFKSSLLKVPYLGQFMHKIKQLDIDRNNNRQGLDTIIKAINQIKKDERCVCVYPEGTRSKSHELQDFHAGTFKIALKANCPIVVSSITNSEAKKYHSIFRPTHIYIDIIDILEYDDIKDLSTEEISEKCHSLIEENQKELNILRDKPYLKKKRA
ncbi:MAG: 1-acyl-sn-glycerol-3-phosphate acyltransferase [Bacilli bacterium]|nr:1-acyl-sn-glycerol-3-phosphate acyltransferase [Bacilli bacterium]